MASPSSFVNTSQPKLSDELACMTCMSGVRVWHITSIGPRTADKPSGLGLATKRCRVADGLRYSRMLARCIAMRRYGIPR